MASYDRSIARSLIPCETPGCGTGCTYAYSCHDVRMGRTSVIFWPLVSLVVVGVVAVIANLLA